MKNLVIICDLGHCSHRIPGLSEELASHGINVEVISPQMRRGQRKYFGINQINGWKLIETPSFVMEYKRFSYLGRFPQRVYAKWRGIAKKYLNTHTNLLSELLATKVKNHSSWLHAVDEEIAKLLEQHQIDVILASGTPFELFGIAASLSAKYDIPWVADYRDLWSQNHTDADATDQELAELEKSIISSASAISTVSLECKELLHKIFTGPIAVVKNASYAPTKELKEYPRKPLTICYTGSIYDQFRDFRHIILALDQVNRDGQCLARIDFIGPSNHLIKTFLNENRNYKRFVNLINERDRDYSFKRQEEADLLLVMNWEDQTRDGALGTKIYEYFRSSVPIIATGGSGNDELCEMLRKSGCGFVSTEVIQTSGVIKEIIQRGRYGLTRNDEYVAEFTYKIQAANLQTVLEKIQGLNK
jgi:hypothetical protein